MAKVNLLTQSEYAKHRGCSAVAVHKAVKAGRISLIDGKIDPAVADIQWSANTRARQPARSAGGSSATGDLLANGAPAGSAGTDVGTAPGSDKPGASPGSRDTLQPQPDDGYSKYRTDTERSNSLMRSMEVGKMAATLTERDRVDMGFFVMARECRDHLTSCSRRIASEVSSLNSAEACESVIDREHRIFLEMLVANLKEHLGSPPARSA